MLVSNHIEVGKQCLHIGCREKVYARYFKVGDVGHEVAKQVGILICGYDNRHRLFLVFTEVGEQAVYNILSLFGITFRETETQMFGCETLHLSCRSRK